MKKVWLWNHYATDMYKNRGGRHYWFAKNLIEKGCEATIFCANTFHNSKEFIDTKGEKSATALLDNIPFVFVKTPTALGNGRDRIKNMAFFYLNLFSTVKKYVSSHGKPDVIVASSVHPLTMVAGIQIARQLNIPCICEVRDLWPEAIFAFNKARENSVLGKALVAGEHWIYRNADALIFTKEGDIDYIKEKRWDLAHGGVIDLDKCNYINNGVDIPSFNKLARENILNDRDLDSALFNVTYTGAIRPVNNVGNIIETAILLKDEKNIQFLIYGAGSEEEELRRLIRKIGLTNVKMKGYVNKQYIPYILSKSSVNLLNYSQDRYNWSRGNSSNKLFEYMASGKPIISTIKMGYSIINKYQCGIELDSCSPEELAKVVLEVKNMELAKYQAMGDNAKTGALDFDFRTLSDKLIQVIEKVT